MTSPDATNFAATLSAVLAEVQNLRAEVAAERPAWGRWLDLQTAAIYSSLSVKSLRRAIAAGRLTGHRLVAGKVLIDRRELDAAIRAAGDQ